MRKHLLAVSAALLLGAFAFQAPARAQEEVPMTPTPTPAVSPIPSYPEKKPAASIGTTSSAEATPLQSGVRIDRAGMFGVGMAIGNTSTGATAKVWFAPEVAMQFGVGSGALGNNVRFQLDLLYTYYTFDSPDGQYALPFYFGVGGQSGIFFKYPYPADRTDLGVRIPFGMAVVIPNNPVELFFEVAPDAGLYDDKTDPANTKTRTIFYVDGQIGARFYF